MTTRATPVAGGGYSVTGTKRWISGGGEADFYVVYARMSDVPGSKGLGAVIVAADAPGVSFGAPERLMGFRGIPSADVVLDEVAVPEADVLVGPGGFRRLFAAFSIERLGNTTMSLAIGQAALDRSIGYVQERTQFGKELIEFQGIQLTLADMVLDVEAARLLQQRAAANLVDGLPDPLEVSLAKCTANEMAKRVTDQAMQLHGGNGYTEEYGLSGCTATRTAGRWQAGRRRCSAPGSSTELLGRTFDQRR